MKSFYIFVILLITIKGFNGLPAQLSQIGEDREKTCRSCTSLVSFIDKIHKNDSNLLENSLTNMCNDYSSLPGKQTKQTCKFMIKSVVELFKNANKQTFCDEISACVSHSVDTSITSNDNRDDTNCNFCVSVVTNVKDIISGQPTELEVKTFIEDACHYLGSFENECVSLSDEYIDTLFAYIRTSLQPKQFCQSIGACSKAIKHKEVEKVADIAEVVNIFPVPMPLTPLKEAEPVERMSDEVECLICKRIVKFVVQELEDNRTEQAIIQALEHVCSLLPQKDQTICNTFVEQYANELIHILIEEGDPDLACTLLGVCVPKVFWKPINYPNLEREDSVKTESNSIKWTEIESPIESESVSIDSKLEKKNKNQICYECELLMHFLQNEIYDYNNEEKVEDFIKNRLCSRMQIVITKEACDTFVDQYGPQVLQLIAQKLFDPSTVCSKRLNLCSNSTLNIAPIESPQIPEFQMSGQTAKCDLCVSLVQSIDTLLENEGFDKEVTKIMEKSCKPLPKSKAVECELMVEAFLPYFLQKIGHSTDANEVCRSIDMCYKAGHVQLLGGHKCTFGPTYWCNTIAHAEACKATHFCKNKVWKAMP